MERILLVFEEDPQLPPPSHMDEASTTLEGDSAHPDSSSWLLCVTQLSFPCGIFSYLALWAESDTLGVRTLPKACASKGFPISQVKDKYYVARLHSMLDVSNINVVTTNDNHCAR